MQEKSDLAKWKEIKQKLMEVNGSKYDTWLVTFLELRVLLVQIQQIRCNFLLSKKLDNEQETGNWQANDHKKYLECISEIRDHS